MKDLSIRDLDYKTIAKLSIISVTTLLMMFAGIASFGSYYHSVYAASKNATSSSSSTSKSGGSSTKNSTSPIGSLTFLNVITKVDNSKGGTSKPSDFTISVSGKSPSPKSFSGSSSGTSVTLKAGKYKVTGSGPSGYTTSYSSGCSGTSSGGTPIKCTISASYSQPSPSPSPSGSNNTSNAMKTPSQLLAAGDDCKYFDNCMYITIKGFIKRSSCGYQVQCPEVNHHKVTVEGYYIYNDGKEYMYQEKHSFIPTNAGTTIAIGVLGSQHKNWDSGYLLTAECVTIIEEGSGAPIDCGPAHNANFRAQQAYLNGGTGTCASAGGGDAYSAVTCKSTPTKTDIHQAITINFHWACDVSFPKHC